MKPGSLNRWDRYHIIPQLAVVYTTYIPLIVLAYWVPISHRSHLLREPSNQLEKNDGSKTVKTPASEGWYHRHGYWATRRKIINFGTKRHVRVEIRQRKKSTGTGRWGEVFFLILGFRWFVESRGIINC